MAVVPEDFKIAFFELGYSLGQCPKQMASKDLAILAWGVLNECDPRPNFINLKRVSH